MVHGTRYDLHCWNHIPSERVWRTTAYDEEVALTPERASQRRLSLAASRPDAIFKAAVARGLATAETMAELRLDIERRGGMAERHYADTWRTRLDALARTGRSPWKHWAMLRNINSATAGAGMMA